MRRLQPLPAPLEGRIVRLEPLAGHHYGPLLALALGDRSTFTYAHVPESAPAFDAYFERALELQADGQARVFATVDLRSGDIVGSTRFFAPEWWDWPPGSPLARDGALDAVEIGYTWLTPAAQRSGVNTEAKLLMLTHAFETWGVRVVRLKTDARNTRSRDAILRLGASFDGLIRYHRPGADGSIRDSALFSIVAPDWRDTRHHLLSLLR